MSDAYLPILDELPPDVLAALGKPTGQLTPGERAALTNWLIKNGPSADPAIAEMIGQKIGNAGGSGAQTDWSQTPEAASYASAARLPRSAGPGPSTQTQPTPIPANDYAGDDMSAKLAGAFAAPYGGVNAPPGGPVDWQAELETLQLNPSSAFADVTSETLPIFANSPRHFSLESARDQGAGIQTASLREPYAAAGMGLAETGVLGGGAGRGLGGGPRSNVGKLELVEDFMDQSSGMGVSVDPESLYRKLFKRVQRTDPATMDTEGGDPGDMVSQVEVTNGALLQAAGPWMTPEAAQGLSNRLDAAADEWLMAVAHGETTQTYPQFIRELKARKWV